MALREQNDGMLCLDGRIERLPFLVAWVNSSSVFWVKPPFPCGEMYFKVAKADASGWNDGVVMTSHPKRGLFRAYLPPTLFTERAEVAYQIVCVDDSGSRHVSGEGRIRVMSSSVPDETEVLKKCILPFTDGVGRYVTVTEDAAGELAFSVSSETVDVPVGNVPLYAYNHATGFYHRVSGVYDDLGIATVSVATATSDDGVDTFVPDMATGFYRHIDATTDTAGEVALAVGEKKI